MGVEILKTSHKMRQGQYQKTVTCPEHVHLQGLSIFEMGVSHGRPHYKCIKE